MPSISIGRGLLIVEDPIVRDDARVEVAHNPLPQIVNTVLIMPLVHLRYRLLGGELLREVLQVVVLPDIMQTVKVVGAPRDSHVAASGRCGRWEEDRRCIGLLPTSSHIRGVDGYGPKSEERVPCLVDGRAWRSFVRGLGPQRVYKLVVHKRYIAHYIGDGSYETMSTHNPSWEKGK